MAGSGEGIQPDSSVLKDMHGCRLQRRINQKTAAIWAHVLSLDAKHASSLRSPQ
jgi:hypothetical protein